MPDRIRHPGLSARRMSAPDAAALIAPGMTVAMSGFTGAGYPKAVPQALAARIAQVHAGGGAFQLRVLTGASTGPELDGALARADAIALRLPYQSDPAARERINAGALDYLDLHLSHVAPQARAGFFGAIDFAMIEVTAIHEDGRLVPSSSLGNNQTWLEQAGRVILEVNRAQPAQLEGMHDIYAVAAPPHGQPIPLVHADDRIGETCLRVDPAKVVAVVETDAPDRHVAFDPPDPISYRIAAHVLEFLAEEVDHGRLPPQLLPLQSGVGNIANAVLAALADGGYRDLGAYTEVIQDAMLGLLKSGVLRSASATAFSLSPAGIADFVANVDHYRERIVLRPQEISNHPELIRRLGCIAMNGAIEADLYGNVNSSHIASSRIMNGIGGAGDFARNAFLSMFMTPSTARGGVVSAIVPMVSHVDHSEHDVMVLVTEHGLADLRGLSPRQRAQRVIERCADPAFRPALQDYFDRACRGSYGRHTPHLLDEALAWHQRFVASGDMRPAG